MTPGNYPAISLANARKYHRNGLTLLEKNLDPGLTKKIDAQEARSTLTVAALADEYMEKWAKPRKRSWKEDLRILNKDILPAWAKSKAKTITRRDVVPQAIVRFFQT